LYLWNTDKLLAISSMQRFAFYLCTSTQAEQALELNGAPQNAQPIRPRVPGNLGSGGYWDMGIGIGVGNAQRKKIVTGLDVKKIFFNVWIII